MINLKPKICKALKTIEEINLSEEYPNDWSMFPAVTYTEEDNSIYQISDGIESMCKVVYRIDIWHNRSTSDIAIEISDVLSKLGLRRTFCKDVPDPSKLKHKVLRFEGIVDIDTLIVYQR